MAKSRRQDLRPEETRRDQVQKLKAIIRALKKENAQLRKQLGKITSFEEDYRELLEEANLRERDNTPPPGERCPECSGPVRVVELGRITLRNCTRCNWRTTKK